jgi:uncharacterized protein YbjT (DUF2867 family)
MFGDGSYRVSPLAAEDLASVLSAESASDATGTRDLGGPVSYAYRELTDRMFAALGREPRYVHLSRRGAIAVTRLLRAFGSTLLYPYEVEWLMSDLLALPPAEVGAGSLTSVESYLESEARRLRSGAIQRHI